MLEQMVRASRLAGYAPALACPAGEVVERIAPLCNTSHLVYIPWFRRTSDPIIVMAMVVAAVRALIQLTMVIYQTRSCIIHANSGVAALAACIPSTLLRRPLVWHQHDVIPNRRVNRVVLGACARFSATVVCTSETVAVSLRQLGVPVRRLQLLHPRVRGGFEVTLRSKAACRSELGLPASCVVMAMVGRLVPRKGHKTFLEAASLLAREGIDIQAIILGSGHDVPGTSSISGAYVRELHQMAQQPELQGRVNFLEYRDDVQSVLVASDVLVVPSVYEPFGIVTLEAFTAGVPVVASNTGGPVEVIEHEVSGLLVRTGDAAAFAAAIRRLLDDPRLRKSMVDEARKQVTLRFSEESLAPALDRLYSELLTPSSEKDNFSSAQHVEQVRS